MINNYICPDCDHFGICKVNDKIVVFHEDAKKSLGVTIKIETCENYKSVDDDTEDEV